MFQSLIEEIRQYIVPEGKTLGMMSLKKKVGWEKINWLPVKKARRDPAGILYSRTLAKKKKEIHILSISVYPINSL